MLISIHVKNLALIDEEEIFFENGLNILTGETGAGKSIIIGSVNLALGAKADKDLIRTGEEYALVELVFQVNEYQMEELKKIDIFAEEDNILIIQRKIMQGRNICKVCGETVNARLLQDIAGILIDIHGQHEHQSLLHKKKHKDILDGFAKEGILKLKNSVKAIYQEYKQLENDLKETNSDEETRSKEAALLRFEIEEIGKTAPLKKEDEELEQNYRKMSNSRKIEAAIGAVYRMTGYDVAESAGETVGRALREIRNVASYDEKLTQLENQLMDIDSLLNDFNRAASDYMSDFKFDEEDFRNIENRLNQLNHLKDKYGKNLEDVIAYKLKNEEKLITLENYEEYHNKMLKQYEKAKEALFDLCHKLSDKRKLYAKELSLKLKNELLKLNFENVEFEIQVRPDKEYLNADGFDDIEFMISTNKGEALKSLSLVASGGELSRIMLAFKTVLADKDDIQTLIFDEIDTGISGKTAWEVSKKLGILSKEHQIICITHLPQIAAMADYHFLIEKCVKNGRTITTIKKMPEEDSTKELARMLGSAEITEAAIENAKEMKDLARNTKQY